MNRIVVTGANGFLGSHLIQYFYKRGHPVLALQRAGRGETNFDLRDPSHLPALGQNDILIHAAYDFKAHTRSEIQSANIDGSLRLIQHARKVGVRRIVFISTMSAYDGCPSLYGRAKREVEDALRYPHELIVRPGLIYSNRLADGMVGALARIVSKLTVVPTPDRGQQTLYAIEVDDLCRAIDEALKAEPHSLPKRPPVLAHLEPLTLKEILRRLAAHQGVKRVYLPIPSILILFGLRTLEALGLRPRTRADSLIGLLNQDPSPDFGWAESMNFKRFLPDAASTKGVDA